MAFGVLYKCGESKLKKSEKIKRISDKTGGNFVNYGIIIQREKRTLGRPSRWLSGPTSGRRR